jgi:hypothetical protein
MIRTTNREAGRYVADREVFKAANTYSEWENNKYVVYSYGRHFPIYVYDYLRDQWYGNQEKYSQTTSCHQSQLHPGKEIEYLNTKELKRIISEDFV